MTILNECAEGEKVAKEGEERKDEGVAAVGEGCLKRASKLKGISKRRITRTAGVKLSSNKSNFGIAPSCMPFEPFIVWVTLGAVLLFIFLAADVQI